MHTGRMILLIWSLDIPLNVRLSVDIYVIYIIIYITVNHTDTIYLFIKCDMGFEGNIKVMRM